MISTSDLIGTWTLLSYELRRPQETVYPLGKDALGRITYGLDGTMGVYLMATNRPPLPTPGTNAIAEKAAAYDSFMAYCGSFEVKGNTVIHHLTMSSVPAWSGTAQVRDLSLKDGQLILALTTTSGGNEQTYRLTWCRYEEADVGPSAR